MTDERVNADNFATAETHRMFAGLQCDAGEVNRFSHNRGPAAVDKQTVIRMNCDRLYGFAVVDVSAGATLTVLDAGEYLSVALPEGRHRSSLRRQRPVGPAARRSSQEASVELVETTAPPTERRPSVELVETTAPPHRRLDP